MKRRYEAMLKIYNAYDKCTGKLYFYVADSKKPRVQLIKKIRSYDEAMKECIRLYKKKG